MKKTDLRSYGSKAAKFLIAGGLVAIIGFSACNKSNNNNATGPNATVTEADAAELTSDAVTPATGGFDGQAKISVSIYVSASAKFTCGEKKDTTITYSSPSNFIPNYSYALSWDYELDCNSGIPSQFAFNFTGASKYNGVLMSSSDNSTGSFTISNPGPTSSTYTFGSSYERSGKETSKVGYQKTFSSDLKFTSSNILISKSTQEIVSGTATITITGLASNGNSFSFNGTITFLGNKTAKLVLNSGTTYNIAWS